MPVDTRDRAKEAFEALIVEGLKPTVERIRDRIGGGGTDLINQVIREMKAQAFNFAKLPEIPYEIRASLSELWTSAVKAAREELGQELTALAMDHEQVKASLVASQHYAAELEGRLTEASKTHTTLQKQLAQSDHARSTLSGELDALRHDHARKQVLLEERTSALGAERGTVAQLREQEVSLRDERMAAETAHLEELSALKIQQHEALSALRASHHADVAAAQAQQNQTLDEKQSIIQAHSVKLAQRESKLEEADREIEALQTSNKSLEDQVREMSGQLATALATVNVVRENEAALRIELLDRSATIERLTTENLTLKTRLARRANKATK